MRKLSHVFFGLAALAPVITSWVIARERRLDEASFGVPPDGIGLSSVIRGYVGHDHPGIDVDAVRRAPFRTLAPPRRWSR